MGKLKDLGKGRFSITYGGLESPMSGVDATHQSGIYLNPTSLANSKGIISQDGYLNSVFLNPRASFQISSPTTPIYVIGDVATNYVTQGASPTITKFSWGFVVVSTPGTLTVYEFQDGFTDTAYRNVISIAANQAINLTWYCINSVVYITGLGLGAIYAYTPIPGSTSTLTLLTNYVGGAYLGELNGRLICACCDQIVGGTYSYYPYQIAWSAAGGQYGIWNPLVSGLVTGAGYNNLPDVADEIVGFFMVGPTGYIIRKQGITEMSPLNSGIQPFDFNHMWASQKGVGSVYPNTVVQYGSLGGFLSDIGVFTLGYSGINQIEGLFWAEINRLLDNLFSQNEGLTQVLSAPNAALIPLYINNERKLVYALYIPTLDGLLCLGDVLSNDWNEIPCFAAGGSVFAGTIQGISSRAFFGGSSGTGYSDQTIACIAGLVNTIPGSSYTLYFYSLDDTLQTPPSLANAPFLNTTPSATFPVEEVEIFKDITVDSILMVGDADVTNNAAITVTPSINNIVYTPVRFTSQAQLVRAYPTTPIDQTSTDEFTAQFPQLSINLEMDIANSSSIRIYKIVMFCSYDPEQTP